jgi:uncharacterized repeat protein (TIGR03803 family)
MPTIDYSGEIAVSGSGSASNGDSITISGTFGVILDATLDGSGNGTASETVAGNLFFTYSYQGGTTSGIIPFDFSDSNLPFQNGSFTGSETIPVSIAGAQFGVTLTGSASSDQSAITENIQAAASGVYMGVTVSANLSASGTLFVAPANAGVTTLASFDFTNGSGPAGDLAMDSAGDIFGVTGGGGANGHGTVFEIANTVNGYASTPTALVSFNGSDGLEPDGGLMTDSAGNLFGTTSLGGANNDGTVFEIEKTVGGYASTPMTLVSFSGSNGAQPVAGLIADSAGDLFGTTSTGGTNNDGTVFEIAKTVGGYASTPTTLVTFDGTNGKFPFGKLFIDNAGDLFGTIDVGGTSGDGAVFEIVKTAGVYATTPTILVSFDGTNGNAPTAGLIADAAGNLFGTTSEGGANNDGTVFEIAKIAGGYAATPTILYSFNGTDGQGPGSNLTIDAAGDLFGTTSEGGSNDEGTAFEIVKAASGYAANAVILGNFDVLNGATPIGGALIANSAGNLFGTTFAGGSENDGTVFQLTNSNFRSHAVSTDFNIDGMSDILWQNDSGQAAIWTMNGFTQLDGQPVGGDPGSNWKVVGTGDFNGDGMADILWQDTDNGQVVVWTMNGFNQTSSTFVGGAPGSDWKMVTTGDFAGNGQADLVFQNSQGQAVLWTMSGTTQTTSTFVGGDPGSQWHIVGTGDFNADGKSDLVWQDSDNGQVVVWTMDGTNQTGSFFVGNAPGSDWKVAGVGDFAGDGQSDLLFQNTTTGQAVIWTMDGTTQTTSTFVGGSPGPTWHIEGTGDYNGDGKADILWQNDNGQAAIWTMNGATQLAGSPVGGNPGTSWHIPAGVG